jgi:CRISPR system Cascade subunit CasE
VYLSRLLLDPFHSRVRRDLGDCHRMHCTVMSGFPNGGESGVGARSRYGVLYRVEAGRRGQSVVLLVQSAVRPSWNHLVEEGYLARPGLAEDNPAIKCIEEQISCITEGMALRFRLRANPTKKVGTTGKSERLSGAQKNNGRRVFIADQAEQIDWLARKGATSGFALMGVRADPSIADVAGESEDIVTGAKPVGEWERRGGVAESRHQLMFRGVVFDGHLRVTDERAFKAALANGIGSGKAYGFGLMSIAPRDI